MLEFFHSLQTGPGSQAEQFNQIVIEWNISCNPDWQVKIRDAGSDYGNPGKVLDLSKEDRPTFILVPEFLKPRMEAAVLKGEALSVEGLLSAETLADISHIAKRTFGSKNGHLECLPLNPSCAGMFVNQDVLSAIGRDPNKIPSSREELETVAAEILARKETLIAQGLLDKDFGIYTCAWPAAYLVEIPLTQKNSPLITPDNGRQGYGQYQLVAAHDLLMQLRDDVKKGLFIYGGQQLGSRDLFLQKKAVFYMQGLGHHPILEQLIDKQERKFNIGVGVVPAPKGLEGRVHAVPIGGASIWVLDNSKTQNMIEGVRAFLNHLASKEVMTKWHSDTACVPVLTSTYEQFKQDGFYESHPVHKAAAQQTFEAQEGEYSFGFHAPNWADARKEIFTAIEKIIERKEDGSFVLPDEAVLALLQEFDQKFSIKK